MKPRKYRYFVGDFETTVYKGQVNTEVWAAASVELYTEDVHIFHSIAEQFEYFVKLDCNVLVYYHNLKFDGSFWLSYLLIDEGYKQAYTAEADNFTNFEWQSTNEMPNNSLTYSISDMGQWYRIIIKVNNHIIEIRDSLKLLPFSVKKIGSSFKTKHKKLDMEYTGLRYAGCDITDEEQKYIANDVLVIKEAVETMFDEGHKKLTIGSCCLHEYKTIIGKNGYSKYFPNIYDIPIDQDKYGSPNAGEYVRKSYRGGWCYVVKGKEKQIKRGGTTADVNSLYPSMMSSESGNRFPVGEPTFWKGNYIPPLNPFRFYFVRIRTRFYLKKNMLPFVQLKSNLMYKATECLETSDTYNHKTGKYTKYFVDFDGQVKPSLVEMTLTQTDFQLLQDHYNLEDLEILDGCHFTTEIGIFDGYMDKYKKIKMESTGAIRELAKLFLNNLYGKMASNTDSSFKVAYVKEDRSLGFYTIVAKDKIPGYIPVGSAITSYARNFTIRHAQMNYYGKDKRGFIYADTDSIHCDLKPEELKGIRVHPTDFCAWKLESCWDIGYFVRQKTYIEHITHENLEPISEPYYNIKCAGMPDKCKKLFIKSMEGIAQDENEKYSQEELDFLYKDKEHTIPNVRTVEDFDCGLSVPGKLLPKRIAGGVLLVETTYEMR